MKYNNIAASLGWTEDHDDTEGGIFLQPEELKRLDKELGAAKALTAKETPKEKEAEKVAAKTSGGLPAFNSPEHPANRLADMVTRPK